MPRSLESSLLTRVVLTFALGAFLPMGAAADPLAAVAPGKKTAVRFSESPPQSSDPLEIRGRLMAAEDPPAYDVSAEEFEILIPAVAPPSQGYGLFIWIDAGNAPRIPAEWEPVLAAHGIVSIAAKNSGNPRNVFDRIRLAIDANHNVRQFLKIDGRRVYVSGFSGGSRVASMLGVAWGEMFSGTICCMGVNFYTDVTAPDSKTYGLSYLPDETLLALVKEHCRYALITGEQDFNLANTLGVFENGFRKEGFRHVEAFTIPGHGHALPPAEWIDKAILFLDAGKR